MLEAKAFLLSPAELGVLIALKHTKKNERHHLSVMALIFSSSSRRCGNVCKRSKGRSCGKQCLRAVGKPAAFPSGREYLFSIGGAAVFHISIVQNRRKASMVHCFFTRDKVY